MVHCRELNWPVGPSKLGVVTSGLDHLPELFELADARRDSGEGVEQTNDLVPGQRQVGPLVGEEDLESGAETGGLQLAPQLALLAADAVHDARDVPEVIPEFEFQLGSLKRENDGW